MPSRNSGRGRNSFHVSFFPCTLTKVVWSPLALRVPRPRHAGGWQRALATSVRQPRARAGPPALPLLGAVPGRMLRMRAVLQPRCHFRSRLSIIYFHQRSGQPIKKSCCAKVPLTLVQPPPISPQHDNHNNRDRAALLNHNEPTMKPCSTTITAYSATDDTYATTILRSYSIMKPG